ncbi:DUF1659 domain-containing protein [Texcoconibacillus texcoconensis]|uniref:DUF1659 domain-containing protein n=1 Tax=Texcoconibacillus texcoconensis TaxID=1095777 RepID=A0A840QSV8_9BACI|nr:DUF1659 domain-containing protein [Texcoconibacillus texcoconensis]MBB5174357.1 hypothetical protein [Texcoconibacillus texcoconensis]
MEQVNDSRLILTLVTGMDEYGEDIEQRRTFQNINTNSSNEDVQAAANALLSLQEHPVLYIQRSNTYDLEEEGE